MFTYLLRVYADARAYAAMSQYVGARDERHCAWQLLGSLHAI